MKILLAEDDLLSLEALATCVEAEGFETLRATDGRQALELWQEHHPVLVCLDIMMPDVGGFEVCRKIRKKDKSVPILFLSAKNEERDIITGLDLGADDFIRKPFTRPEVMARIRATLRRCSVNDSQEEFRMDDLTVRPTSLLAIRDDQPIDLTPREVSMLRLLFTKAGTPVSRNDFLDECWGIDYFPDSRTLDQHILMLRKKIERDPSAPRIISPVRGIGYRYKNA